MTFMNSFADWSLSEAHIFEMDKDVVLKFCLLLDMDQFFQS